MSKNNDLHLHDQMSGWLRYCSTLFICSDEVVSWGLLKSVMNQYWVVGAPGSDTPVPFSSYLKLSAALRVLSMMNCSFSYFKYYIIQSFLVNINYDMRGNLHSFDANSQTTPRNANNTTA